MRPAAKVVALKAYAKINLGLAVIGRRGDGYHELRTIYQSISLADDLEVSLLPAGPNRSPGEVVWLEATGITVPEGRQNLAVRSAEAVLDELKLKRRVSLRLRKKIPTGSGLGGASSDAAAVIRALLYLANQSLPPERLIHLAASLGSDVPFFLFGGRALGVGRGEEIYPLPEGPRRYCVVLYPRASVSTAEAYRQLKSPLLTRDRANHNIELFCGRANHSAEYAIGNDFERVVFQSLPSMALVKRNLERLGSELASLSGSGSAVFGVFSDRRRAEEAVRRLQKPGCDVFLTRTVSRREFQAQLPGSAEQLPELGRRPVVGHKPLTLGT